MISSPRIWVVSRDVISDPVTGSQRAPGGDCNGIGSAPVPPPGIDLFLVECDRVFQCFHAGKIPYVEPMAQNGIMVLDEQPVEPVKIPVKYEVDAMVDERPPELLHASRDE